jgi:hypothetical protein
MLQTPSPPPRKIWTTALATMAAMCGTSLAENFTMMVTNPDPLGISAFVPSEKEIELGLEGKLKGAFNYGLGLQSIYDSNFFQTESNEESELSLFLNPSVFYTSDPEGGATYSLTASYTPTVRCYLNNSDLNGMDQSGSLNFTYRGGKTQFDAFGRYSQVTGTDLLTGEFVEGTIATAGMRVTRQIAPRTSLAAGLSYAQSDYGSSDSVGSTVYTANLDGIWQATERLGFGPSLRYTASESDNIDGTRNAFALMISARYRMGERLWFSASLGPEYSMVSGSDSDDNGNLSLTGNLAARYAINDLWTWTNSIDSGAAPSPNQQDFVINNVSVTSSLQRKLLRGWLSGGLDYNFSSYQEVGAAPGDGSNSNENNLSVFLGYGRNLFSERVAFNSELRYAVNDGDTDWSQIQVTLGLSVAF